MYRRAPPPSQSPGLFKPFKTPTPAASVVQRALPPRKRKRVSYKENNADNDSDEDGRNKKKKKNLSSGKDDADYADPDAEVVNINRIYPVFKPKPFEEVARKRFSIPEMKNAAGEIIPVVMSGISLGIRPQAILIPRPLHDPMADHAIVLYDPTTDDRETDEERKEREAQELKEKEEKERAEALETTGLYNPHKSLKSLLGSGKEKKSSTEKVPVVIDPRLSKVLRPHQVEGVKAWNLAHLYCARALMSFRLVPLPLCHWDGRRKPIWVRHIPHAHQD